MPGHIFVVSTVEQLLQFISMVVALEVPLYIKHCNWKFLYIGNWVDLSGHFPGKIDNVQIYNKALTNTEVRNLSIRVPAGLMAMFDFKEILLICL